jgi:hypothetical protein
MIPPGELLPCVSVTADMEAHDGEKVRATGIYCAIPKPKKGPVTADGPKSHAFVELDDGQRVYLEAYGVERATRPEDELRSFDGRRVTIVGVAHRIMPSPGAGLMAPCLSEVESVVEAESRGS